MDAKVAVGATCRFRRLSDVRAIALGDRWLEHGLVFISHIGTPLDPTNVTHRFKRFPNAAGCRTSASITCATHATV